MASIAYDVALILLQARTPRGWDFRERQDEEQTITTPEPDAATHLPPQYDELMSERRVLCLKSAFRLERRGEQGQADRTTSNAESGSLNSVVKFALSRSRAVSSTLRISEAFPK
jgi:hypothetical protein